MKLTRIPYLYTDILKQNKDFEEKDVNRILSSLDSLSGAKEFFKYIVLIDSEIKQKPRLMYFFRKILSVVLDETFDNVNNFVQHSNDEDKRVVFSSILEGVPNRIIESCREFRNNIHYKIQKEVYIGDADYSYNCLLELISTTELIINNMSRIINVKTFPIKSKFLQIIAWAQSDTLK